MTKKPLRFSDQINFLALAGTHAKLVAVSFYIGGKGAIGKGAKNIIDLGLNTFLNNLTPPERRRFDEILASVQVAERLNKEIEHYTPGS